MTVSTSERRRALSLRMRMGDGAQDMPVMLRGDREGFVATYDPERASLDGAVMLSRVRLSSEGFTVSEVILENHDPDLTTLHSAASKLRIAVEFTSGPYITEPAVKKRTEDASEETYFIPEGWDPRDALKRLPEAFTGACPDIARGLALIEQAKQESGGRLDRLFDLVARMVLDTGDPARVFNDILRLLVQVQDQKAGVADNSPVP